MVIKAAPKKESCDLYTYRVTWSQEDEEYVGLCAEFPSLSWLDCSKEAALKGIGKVVAAVVSDMKSNNESIPQPLALKQYKGTFTVRIPPETHRKLAIQAAESQISVNRLISVKLAGD
jgi:predicted HicB family RNase H-like nuclease